VYRNALRKARSRICWWLNDYVSANAGAGPPRGSGDCTATMILIVDDEAGIRETLRRFLAQRGFEVSTAANSAEALLMLRQAPPTAMILDIRMPDPTGRMRSGLDLLRFIRGQSELVGLPVLALTGHLLSREDQAALHAHDAEVFYKPVELRLLADHLAAMTASDRGHAVPRD
jgi:DNA-binding response OmpR family regulator